MRTLFTLAIIFAISAFIFSATVNAAYALAENLLPKETERVSIEQLMKQ